MTDGSSDELVLTPPAVRAIRSGLPEAVAAAVIGFVTPALVYGPAGWANRSEETWLAFTPLDEVATGCCTE